MKFTVKFCMAAGVIETSATIDFFVHVVGTSILK